MHKICVNGVVVHACVLHVHVCNKTVLDTYVICENYHCTACSKKEQIHVHVKINVSICKSIKLACVKERKVNFNRVWFSIYIVSHFGSVTVCTGSISRYDSVS